MFTRGHLGHAYTPVPVQQVNNVGLVQTSVYNNIPQMWPISRPGSSPGDMGSPDWIAENTYLTAPMQRGGTMALSPTRPRVEADLTNAATWQRQYRLT